MEASDNAIQIIKAEEDLQLEAYQDGVSIAIGYGHNNTSGGEQFKLGDTITEEKAEELFQVDLAEAVRIVNQRMKNYGVTFNQGQFDAMVIATYNRSNKVKSKKLYTTVASGDMEAIKKAWDNTISKADRENYPGLIRRLEAELGAMGDTNTQTPDRGIPTWHEEGFEEGHTPQPEVTTIPQNKMQEFKSQVPVGAQMNFKTEDEKMSYARVKQMLEAQVNKQKKQAGHTPYIPGVPPQVTFSDAIQVALELLGR